MELAAQCYLFTLLAYDNWVYYYSEMTNEMNKDQNNENMNNMNTYSH